MAVLNSMMPTLLDLTSTLDPSGKIAVIGELLHQSNEIIRDVPFVEGNLLTGHMVNIRTGLPTPVWRKFYKGIPSSKSTYATVTDVCAMMRSRLQVDKELADLGGSPEMFQFTEAVGHIEAMGQMFARTLFYGDNAATPEEFHGLAPRYSSLGGTMAGHVISGGGSGSDNASIWLIGWGPHTIFGIYPKGSRAGIQIDNRGLVDVQDPDGSMYRAHVTYFGWDCGLSVKDWRYAVRICNIDRSALKADASSGANLPNLMAQALDMIPETGGVARFCFYMDREIRFRWRQQMGYLLSNSTLSQGMLGATQLNEFHGVPVKRTDALLVNEAAVA